MASRLRVIAPGQGLCSAYTLDALTFGSGNLYGSTGFVSNVVPLPPRRLALRLRPRP
jgi:hypothetical protein